MPAKSEKQRRLMYGIMSGSIKKKGVSKKDAAKVLGKGEKKSKRGHGKARTGKG